MSNGTEIRMTLNFIIVTEEAGGNRGMLSKF